MWPKAQPTFSARSDNSLTRTSGGDEGGGPAYPCPVENYWVAVFWTLLPTVLVSALFFYILHSILRADRTERRVYARIESEQRAKRGLPAVDSAATDASR